MWGVRAASKARRCLGKPPPRAAGAASRCSLSAKVEAVWREQWDGLHGLRLFARISLSFTLSVDVINCADGMLCQQQSRKHQKMSQKRQRGLCSGTEARGSAVCRSIAAASPASDGGQGQRSGEEGRGSVTLRPRQFCGSVALP